MGLCVVTDNGTNMVKEVGDCGLLQLPCFAHTLNLAVKKAINQSKEVNAIFQSCRDLVLYFKQSSLASS